MFCKELLKDLKTLHLVNCGWYFDYLKENIPTSKFSLCEKNKTRILRNLAKVYKCLDARREKEGVYF